MTKSREFSVAQIAGMLEIPESTIRNWIFIGKMKSIKRVGRRLIEAGDLLVFLQTYNVPIPDALQTQVVSTS